MANADRPEHDRESLPLGDRRVELGQSAEQRVRARLSRAQDVVGYVAVPGYGPPDSRPDCILYIAAYVENSLFCRVEEWTGGQAGSTS
jgi:hypothetical protein